MRRIVETRSSNGDPLGNLEIDLANAPLPQKGDLISLLAAFEAFHEDRDRYGVFRVLDRHFVYSRDVCRITLVCDRDELFERGKEELLASIGPD